MMFFLSLCLSFSHDFFSLILSLSWLLATQKICPTVGLFHRWCIGRYIPGAAVSTFLCTCDEVYWEVYSVNGE